VKKKKYKNNKNRYIIFKKELMIMPGDILPNGIFLIIDNED